MILRARIILPVTGSPITDGAVIIAGNKIRSVTPFQQLRPQLRKQVLDLGDVIVLPGLVNAHCHLDYTDMAGELPPPKTFTDWIAAITAAKADWSYSDYARSWLHGAHQLLKNGTTTVGDIEAMPDLLPEVWESTPLRVISFIEMTGIKSRRAPKDILREAIAKIESLKHPHHRAALSPHAPYSTRAELLRLTARISRQRKIPTSIHVAESLQESEMFLHARGRMHDHARGLVDDHERVVFIDDLERHRLRRERELFGQQIGNQRDGRAERHRLPDLRGRAVHHHALCINPGLQPAARKLGE